MGIATETLDRVESHLNYTAEGAGFTRRLVPIHDGRAVVDQMTLDRQGFVLRAHETAVSNFFDPAQVRSIYYPEIEQLLKEATGADRAVAFEHDVRSASAAERHATGARQAVKAVHDDYTEKSAPERVRLYLPQEAEALLKERYAVINVWRAIRGPVLDTPLRCAVYRARGRDTDGGGCQARSIHVQLQPEASVVLLFRDDHE